VYHRHRLVRRYAPQRAKPAARVLSLIIDLHGLKPTNSLRKKECPVAPKNRLSNDFSSLIPGQLDSEKASFIVLKAILTFII
jgi:hypothetical protein